MASKDIRVQIKEAGLALREVMEENLSSIGESLIDQATARFNRSTPSQELVTFKDIEPKGVGEYKTQLRDALSVIARLSIEEASRPFGKKFSFLESLAMKFDEYDKLPPSVRKRVQVLSNLTAEAQVADLKKNVAFQYTSSVGSTDSTALIKQDMKEAAADFIAGQAVAAGSATVAAQVVAAARTDFFFQDEVLEQVDAFQFVNGDPVSPVCEDLAGTIFAKDDPEAFRYFPPLHWNCKSYIVPILTGKLKGREVLKLRPSTEKAAASIQFSEQRVELLKWNFSLCKLAEMPADVDERLARLYSDI